MLDKNETRTRKGDFAIKILSFVEAGENTGYFCKIKRQMDTLQRYGINTTTYFKEFKWLNCTQRLLATPISVQMKLVTA